ncbi:MAG: hypothetical protein HYY93_09235 [Planctomycetes bacterium]|nr:hypothetical protein [Planctomycetota bacterium]
MPDSSTPPGRPADPPEEGAASPPPPVPTPAPPASQPGPQGQPPIPDWELIGPETLVLDLIEKYPESESLFRELGLHCWECEVAIQDPLREVARLHEKPLAPIVAAFREMAKRHFSAGSGA